MEKIVLILHVLTALAIIAAILIQQGKGAEAGASFGSGASQTVFGSAGGWNFFSKLTAILATIFFLTSFGLAVIAKNNSSVEQGLLPELEVFQNEIESASDMPQSEPSVDISDIPSMDAQADQPESADLPSEIPAESGN